MLCLGYGTGGEGISLPYSIQNEENNAYSCILGDITRPIMSPFGISDIFLSFKLRQAPLGNPAGSPGETRIQFE